MKENSQRRLTDCDADMVSLVWFDRNKVHSNNFESVMIDGEFVEGINASVDKT
jgi:hypothetical protein